MTDILFLFDLDGTLLLSGGAGMRAMEKVFLERYDLPDAFSGILPDGKIDPAIFREIIAHRNLKIENENETVRVLCESYIKELALEMPISRGAKLMPGVTKLLELLANRQGVQQALLTGNLEQGARIKCERFDLNRFFPFGAYGSDHEDRAELVRIAVTRASEYLGREVPMGKNVFVIGDTPRDVDCGLANGTTTVGVATNNFSAADLAGAGADFVFEDFSDAENVVETLLGIGME